MSSILLTPLFCIPILLEMEQITAIDSWIRYDFASHLLVLPLLPIKKLTWTIKRIKTLIQQFRYALYIASPTNDLMNAINSIYKKSATYMGW